MKLGIRGGGGLGREVLVLADQINAVDRRWDEIVFLDDVVPEKTIKGRRKLMFSEAVELFLRSDIEIVVAIGEPFYRAKLFAELTRTGYAPATLVHPEVFIPSCTILGAGTVVNRGCFVSCDVRIGENTFFQPLSSIGHDSVVGKNSVIGSFVAISGQCRIGEECYLAVGTTIRDKTNIGDRCILGMGAVVQQDIPDDVIALGNPARPMKRNENRLVFG